MKMKIAVTAMLAFLAFAGCSDKETPTPEKQKLSDATATLKVGETKELKVTPESKGLVWSSDDPTVASVAENSGLVTANKAGATTIRVEDPATKFIDKCEVTVEAVAASHELVTKTLNIKVGATDEIEVTPDKEGLTWLSDQVKIASVNATGVVTGNKVGAVTITVKNVPTQFQDECKVTIEGNYNTFAPVITQWGITKEALKAKETRIYLRENIEGGQDYLIYKGENDLVGGDVYYAFHKQTGLLIRVEMWITFTSESNKDKEWQEMLNFWGERMIQQSITDDRCTFNSIDGKTEMLADLSSWDYSGEGLVAYEPVE